MYHAPGSILQAGFCTYATLLGVQKSWRWEDMIDVAEARWTLNPSTSSPGSAAASVDWLFFF